MLWLCHEKNLMELVYISHSRSVIEFLLCKHFIWSCSENIYGVACKKGKQTHLNRQIKWVHKFITTIHYQLLYSLSYRHFIPDWIQSQFRNTVCTQTTPCSSVCLKHTSNKSESNQPCKLTLLHKYIELST